MLNQAAQKMSANMYQQQAHQQSASGCQGNCGAEQGPYGGQDDDVIDAEFQNVA